jgi:hypothetical protein
VIIQVIVFYFALELNNLQLVDTDCYMRLVRVQQLFTTGDWYNDVIYRSNWPYGEVLHWSRLLDVILIIGAYIGTFVVDFNTALFWWGMFISPVVHIFTLLSLVWAARVGFNQESIVRLVFLFLGQIGIWGYCYIGRPDHHSILLCLFLLLFGCCIRMVDNRYGLRYGIYAGILAATAMWVSVEALAAIFMVMCILTILWIGKVEKFAAQGEAFSLTLLLFCAIYIVIEFPPIRVLEVVYDKLSLVHVVVFLLSTLFWMQIRWIAYKSRSQRFGIVIVFSCISGIILQYYFPGIFHGPFAGIDPRIIPIWLSKVQEMQPLLDFSRWGIVEMLIYIGPMTICLPYMVYRAIIRREVFTREWLVYGVGMSIYIPLALYQARWSAYAEVVMLFPMAFILQEYISKLDNRCKNNWRVIVKALFTVVFCFGYFMFAQLVLPFEEVKEPITVTKMAIFLNDPSQLGAIPKTIATDVDFGPEILYRTSHRVIATPYHRNGDGIIFMNELMKAQTDNEVYQLLCQRKVDLILLCRQTRESAFDDDSLYGRLQSGQYPECIVPIKLPVTLQGDWLLYKVSY